MVFEVTGAKNSALPLIYACAAIQGKICLGNFPKDMIDVQTTINGLRSAGLRLHESGCGTHLDASHLSFEHLDCRALSRSRYSLLLLSLAHIQGKALSMPHPGGCHLDRKHDIHLEFFRRAGSQTYDNGRKISILPGGKPREVEYHLPLPSVGASINIILAALGGQKITAHNLAKEPEVIDVLRFVESAGVEVRSSSDSRTRLDFHISKSINEWLVLPDRAQACTWLALAISMRKSIRIKCFPLKYLQAEIQLLRRYLPALAIQQQDDAIEVDATKLSRKTGTVAHVVGEHYPGVSSDNVPIIANLLGEYYQEVEVRDHVYGKRFLYSAELEKFGYVVSPTSDGIGISIRAPEKVEWNGKPLSCRDLRGSVVLAFCSWRAGALPALEDLSPQIRRGIPKLMDVLGGLNEGH